MPVPPVVAAPTVKMKPAEIDRMLAPKAQKVIAVMRRICADLPDVSEGTQMGSVVWRTGKRSFFMLYDYGKGLTAQFWVGIERQGPLEMDPRLKVSRYMGHKGWMDLDLADLDPSHVRNAHELREFAIESYRHFASRRAIAALDAQMRVA